MGTSGGGVRVGCDGVILVPWQQAFTPDEVVAIGERLVRGFGAA